MKHDELAPQRLQECKETTLLNGRVQLLQPNKGFHAGLDSVFVAAAVPDKAGGRLLDLGCGVGSAGFCALARLPELSLTGVEIQAELVDLATQNAELNGWADRAEFLACDIRDLKERNFDHVVCNPPYLKPGAWVQGEDDTRNQALGHADQQCDLSVWMKQAYKCLKPRGSLSMIHRADALDEIMALAHGKFGGIEVWLLYPREGEDAKRVVMRMVKDSKTPTCIHSGIIIHDDKGYTLAADSVLREMQPLL